MKLVHTVHKQTDRQTDKQTERLQYYKVVRDKKPMLSAQYSHSDSLSVRRRPTADRL